MEGWPGTLAREALLPAFVAHGQQICWNLAVLDVDPLCRKRTRVAKQWPPNIVTNVYANVEFLISVLKPFAHIGHTGKSHWELKANWPLVKTLFS